MMIIVIKSIEFKIAISPHSSSSSIKLFKSWAVGGRERMLLFPGGSSSWNRSK